MAGKGRLFRVGQSASFVYEDTEPTSGNYYPVTNRVFLRDDNRQLTVLTDRSQGATSREGMLEIMVTTPSFSTKETFQLHRRCFVDDHFGVEEALDEPGTDGKGLIARGTHYVLLTPAKEAASVHRPLALEIFNKPVLSFAPLGNPTEFKKNNNLKVIWRLV